MWNLEGLTDGVWDNFRPKNGFGDGFRCLDCRDIYIYVIENNDDKY